MRISVKQFVSCVLIAGMVITASGCNQKAVATSTQEKDIYVEVQSPEVGDLVLTTDYIGTVEPNELVSVLPKVAGTVLETYFNVGDPVKKGDLLFTIDPQDIQLQVNVAQAQLMSAQAQMDQALGSSFDIQLAQMETQLKSAQNAYSTARQNLRDYNDGAEDAMDKMQEQASGLKAKTDALRDKIAADKATLTELEQNPDADRDKIVDLKASIQINQNTYEDLMEQYLLLQANYNEMDDDDSSTHKSLRMAVKNAQIAYDSASEIYEMTKNDVHNDAIKVANAQLGQATAAFEATAKQLEYCKVYSPIDGVIEQRNVEPQGMATQSSPAYTVSNKSTMMVTFYVASSAVEEMAVGDPVTIENGQKTYSGTIAEIGSMVDMASGLFKVKATVDGDDGSLLTGISVKVSAQTAKAQNSLMIPQSTLYYEEGSPYVYLLKDGFAVKTPVEVGISNAEQVEILSGISAGAQIISSWNPNLTDGVKVSVAGETLPEADSASSMAESAVSTSSTASEPAASSQAQED